MPVTPGKLNLTIYQGATFRRTLKFELAPVPPATVGGPINLTGATARMQIRASVDASTVLLELNAINGRLVIIDEQGGVLLLEISAADTAVLNFPSAVYDMEIEYANGDVDRVLYGAVKLSKEVTR